MWSCSCWTNPPPLDPPMEAVFQDYILEVKAAGRTVLLSSHVLAQVDVLADRWAITA